MSGVVALALFIWWWRGVHAKSKEEQAAEHPASKSGRIARRAEKIVSGGVGLADQGEYLKGANEPVLPPASVEPFIPPQDPGRLPPGP